MNRFVCISLAAFLLLTVLTRRAWAAHPMHGDDHKIHYVGATPDSVEMTHALLDNAPETYSSLGLPRFALIGSSGKFGIGVGGEVKLTGSYDFGRPLDDPDRFRTSHIPTGEYIGNSTLFQFGYGGTRVYANAIGFTNKDRVIGAFISVNFLGTTSYIPKIQYAYLRMGGFQIGYDYSLFCDVAAAPPTVDYESANALPSKIVPSIRYVGRFGKGKKCRMGLALENTTAAYTVSASTGDIYQRVPDVPIFFQYNWGRHGWFRIAAVGRTIQYRDLTAEKNVYQPCWGFSFSGAAPIARKVNIYWQAAAGKGISTMFQDLAGMPVDLMPSPSREGRLMPVLSTGSYIAAQWNISRRLFLSGTFSYLRLFASEYPTTFPEEESVTQTPWSDQYRYAQYAAANLCWNVTSWLRLGAEYVFGRRVDMSGASGANSRLQLMLKLHF